MEKNKHCIQILTLRDDGIKIIGFLYVEDRKQIVYNYSIKGYEKGHLTWHKDGSVHTKDHKGKILFSHKRRSLNKFRGKSQFLFSASAKESNINLDYKLVEDSATFLIDIRQFSKSIGLSIHVCDYWNVNTTMKTFENKPHHQSFVYWKSNPKIVIIAFDN